MVQRECKGNPLFINFPFTTNVVFVENNMGDALDSVLATAKVDCQITSTLIVHMLATVF
jgi:hypothetical protein